MSLVEGKVTKCGLGPDLQANPKSPHFNATTADPSLSFDRNKCKSCRLCLESSALTSQLIAGGMDKTADKAFREAVKKLHAEELK